jgi:hypothetical protein
VATGRASLRCIECFAGLASAVADAWCRATRFAPRLARRSIEIATVHQVMRHERPPAHV